MGDQLPIASGQLPVKKFEENMVYADYLDRTLAPVLRQRCPNHAFYLLKGHDMPEPTPDAVKDNLIAILEQGLNDTHLTRVRQNAAYNTAVLALDPGEVLRIIKDTFEPSRTDSAVHPLGERRGRGDCVGGSASLVQRNDYIRYKLEQVGEYEQVEVTHGVLNPF